MSKWIVWENVNNGTTGEMEKDRFLRNMKRPGFGVFGIVKEFSKKEGFVPPESKENEVKETKVVKEKSLTETKE